MKMKFYKRVLSVVMTAAMLLSWVKLPAKATPANEAVTLELTGYAGYGTSTSTGKHFAFSTSAASKTALNATSWFAGASPSTNYGSFTTLTGKILVDGVEEEATIRFNGSGSALYIEKSQTYLEEGKEIVLPKENVFTVTKSNGGTLVSGAQLQFAQTYALTYDAQTQKPVLTQRFFVELAGYAGYGTSTSTGKHFAFSTTADTKTALNTTAWFAGASPSTNYGSFTTLTGKVLVDGVEEEATLRFNASGSALYIEKSQTYLEAGKTFVIPKANVFTVTKSNGGTINSKELVQFVDTYKLTYDATTQKPVLEVVVEVPAKEKVTVTLAGYAGYGTSTSTGKHYAFSTAAATKTALNATSWFAGTSPSTQYGSFTTMTGKVLVDGVEEDATFRFNASGSALYIEKSQTYLEAGKTIVLPKDNVFTVTKSNGGTLDNGGQIQFAENYKLSYDSATQKPVLGIAIAAKEKVTVELSGYAGYSAETSAGKHYAFSTTAATKTALAETSWFAGTSPSTQYGSFTTLTGKVLVDGVETEATFRFNASGSALYMEKSQTYLEAGKTIVLPKANVFTITKSNGGTLDNGGEVQFAKSYKLTYDATTQKPVLGLDPKDCTHAWDATTGTCTLCQTECGHANVTNDRCDTCGHTVYTVKDMQVGFDQVSGNNWNFTITTDTLPQTKAYLKATAIVDGEAKTVYFHYYEVNKAALTIYPQCFAGGVAPAESFKLAKDTVLEAWTAPNGTKLQGVPAYRISEDLEVKKTNGVWLDSKTTVQDMQVGFNSVDSNSNWYLSFTTDPMPAQKAYLKATAVVDGEVKTVWLHYATAGGTSLVIYHQTFPGGVIPVESLKLEKDTLLEAWTAPNGTKLQNVPVYRISEDLEVKKTNGVWLDSKTTVQDMQVGFNSVDSNSNWYLSFTTDPMPEQKVYLKGTAVVDGEVKTVWLHYATAGGTSLVIYHQTFPGGVVPVENLKLEKDTLLEAWTAPNGTKLQNVPVYRISEDLEVKKTNGVWLDSKTTVQDMQVGFNSVDSNSNWYLSFTTDPMPEQKVYLKGTAVVDGEVKTVWLHYATAGGTSLVIYHQTFPGGVVPVENLKLEKDTLLEAWTAPNGTKLQNVPVYRISEDLEVKKTNGVWLDSDTSIQGVQIFFEQVDATKNYWYFSAKGDCLPEESVYLQGQALVDGVEQKVFFHYTGANGVYIYSQCFTKGVPTESFQLLPGTLLIPCKTPNSGRIPGATVLMVTNETTANKAEGILWVGSSKDRAEPELVDPMHATVEYAGTTQNMLWLRVTTKEGKKLGGIYGDRKALKGKMTVGLLNKEGGFTEYVLENVAFQVLEGSLYVSVPGLNALEKVYISAGTVLTPSDSALSNRSIIIENVFHLERNQKDKWELRSKTASLPQTGDSFNPVILISVMVLSLVGMAVTLVFYRKKKRSY